MPDPLTPSTSQRQLAAYVLRSFAHACVAVAVVLGLAAAAIATSTSASPAPTVGFSAAFTVAAVVLHMRASDLPAPETTTEADPAAPRP